jgi:hypothetical protein
MATAEIADNGLSITERLNGNQVIQQAEVRYIVTDATSLYDAAASLPPRGAILDTDGLGYLNLRVRARTVPELLQNSGVYQATVIFDNESTTEEDEQESQIAPEFRTPKWEWSHETVEEALLYDALDANQPIVNSVGEPLFISAPVAIPVLTITRWQTSFSPTVILNYVNRTNSDEFWGAAVGQALLAGVSDREDVVDGRRLRLVTYTIKFRMDQYGWKARLLDHSTWYWDNTLNRYQRFTDDAGNPITGNLNGSKDGFGLRSDTAVFLEYSRFAEATFGDLNLGPY